MKKFIFWLIFLIIIAGVVGYFGWIRVPENNVALGFSTITGYDTAFMESGKINWRWQKLIPKCYVLKMYPLDTESTEISVSQSLPSGELYAREELGQHLKGLGAGGQLEARVCLQRPQDQGGMIRLQVVDNQIVRLPSF